MTACWAVALSGLSLNLLLLKLALASLVAASRLVLLPGISGRAVQAPSLLLFGPLGRCSACKERSAASACEPSSALPLAVLLHVLLAWFANSHPLRQCDHYGFKFFHWLHLVALAALQMVKGPATCQASRLHFFIHLFQLCSRVAVLDLVDLAVATDVLDGAAVQLPLVRPLGLVLTRHAVCGQVGPDLVPLFKFEAVNFTDLLTEAAGGERLPSFTVSSPVDLLPTKLLEQQLRAFHCTSLEKP